MDPRATCDALRVVSLDGGGIRGLSSLLILEHLMERVHEAEGLAEVPRPCDRFDMIGGTSTGGIIAIMLGRLRMTEGNTGTIHLEDDDPLAVKLMIHYLYHLDYPHQDDISHPFLADTKATRFTFSVPEPPNSAPLEDSDEKTQKAALKSSALHKFKTEAGHWWMSADFLRATEEVYTSTVYWMRRQLRTQSEALTSAMI
ncbi:uncharacterized protein VDAG_02429 [Verticillium dahliae VdLs.17]|uniref:PNPLA domain-containing protein n=1 Tax=Verticillium dahliae (strain VdLs.17 / ATCC MYA-4575 / FGSC 10137) TaxID=498257 RepID=G2WXU7_VERDV|nr:uncharacterized protein VDAG_02429 [Verticillium dahliae VdLs.17]EGY20905.1 hypothetical protein VDAG_02429 [Verticillium dahliae VdLs.17]